tara:strand:- start:1394 stop:1786 length:393 start_codon:yes stop_codon:yes gene_type:complete
MHTPDFIAKGLNVREQDMPMESLLSRLEGNNDEKAQPDDVFALSFNGSTIAPQATRKLVIQVLRETDLPVDIVLEDPSDLKPECIGDRCYTLAEIEKVLKGKKLSLWSFTRIAREVRFRFREVMKDSQNV